MTVYPPMTSPTWCSGRLTVLTAPTELPITVDSVKRFLKITTQREDADIEEMIRSEALLLSQELYRPLTTMGLRLSLDAFPDVIQLPYPPLIDPDEVAITYLDLDNVRQTLDADLYRVTADADRALVQPAFDEVWPSSRVDYDSVQVEYDVGHATAAEIALDVKLLLKWRIRLQREDHMEAPVRARLEAGAKRMLATLVRTP